MNERGFSLLQVLMALLILSIITFGFLSVQSRTLTATTDANLRAQAIHLLANQAEIIATFDGAQKQRYRQIHEALLKASQDNNPHQTYQQAAFAHHLMCYAAMCDAQALAQDAAIQAAQLASQMRLLVGIQRCDAAGEQLCLLAAWGADALADLQAGCQISIDKVRRCVKLSSY